ncbi:hypothetical protein Slin14017_G041160 [Septoria linicola]|nr:hypothetical protein Slin14017_G041160 [Septoria linicola]
MNCYPLPPQYANYGFASQLSSKKPKTLSRSRRSSCKNIDAETKRNTRLNSLPPTYSESHDSAATPSIRTTRTTSTTSTLSSTSSKKSKNPLKQPEKSTSNPSLRSSSKTWLKRAFTGSSSSSAAKEESDIEAEDKERAAMWRSMSMGYAHHGMPWV